ncbi:MAG TPA: sensor domain-containing diguanylate cyclase [Thermoanaerobaculaceae bacterium]|nr:sensor domain-containing diguanylate cyclase [Thermoanaerobaculaceae bacterium]
MKTHCISNPELGSFLKREPRALAPYELDLASIFCNLLTRANDFVPSEAGSIFIDDPSVPEANRPLAELVLIACFGEASDRLVGSKLPVTRGIVGHVYGTGRSYVSASPQSDPLFFSGFDGASRFRTRSLLCAPLVVEGQVIGVIELVNRLDDRSYDERDLMLLEIFAQTISVSIANAIDAYRSKEISKRDELTGLYNDRFLHHGLQATIEQALAQGQEVGLLFLDLDHFKTINDIHGHLAGSRVLTEVGAMLRQILPGGCLGARYGGDEFIIVLPGASPPEAFWVAETIRKNIESYVFLSEADPHDSANYPAVHIKGVITCSIGVATLRSDVLSLPGGVRDPVSAKNELLRSADSCMYMAKERGRNLTVTAWTVPPRPRRSASEG